MSLTGYDAYIVEGPDIDVTPLDSRPCPDCDLAGGYCPSCFAEVYESEQFANLEE